jgi:DNA topoisomerase-2
VIQHLKTKLTGQPSAGTEFVPYYEGFKGTVSKIADKKFLIQGCYEKVAEDKIRITELPVGTWTRPYVSFLESLVDGQVDKAGKKSAPVIKDFTSVSTEVSVDILVTFPKDRLRELETMAEDYGCNGVHKLLKLTTTVSTTNMHMFDAKLKLHKYDSVEEIIDDFYGVRLNMYQKRKDYLVVDMEKKLVKLSNRARYIQMTLEGTVDLRRKTAVQVTELLNGLKFAMLDGDYKYLIKMAMDSVTSENVAAILKEKADTETQLETLKATPLEKMWLTELQMLEVQYEIYKGRREKLQEATTSVTDKKKVVVKKVVAKK